MQLVYFIDLAEDNQNIARDRFVTNTVNVMKNNLLVAKKTQGNCSMLYINLSTVNSIKHGNHH